MAAERIGHRAWDGAERGLVQHDVDVGRGTRAGFGVANVALNEFEPPECFGANARRDIIQVVLVACGKTVQPDHGLFQAQQRLQQMRSDEACDPSDEPTSRRSSQSILNFQVRRHFSAPAVMGSRSAQTRMPRLCQP